MPQPNIRLYLILSGIFAIILVTVIFITLNRKTPSTVNTDKYPTPTGVDSRTETSQTPQPTISIKQFTGVEEQELPQGVAIPSRQKQELRNRVPFDTGLFKLDFDYSQDRFTVSLQEPKNENLKQFEQWKSANYPNIPMDQFIFQ